MGGCDCGRRRRTKVKWLKNRRDGSSVAYGVTPVKVESREPVAGTSAGAGSNGVPATRSVGRGTPSGRVGGDVAGANREERKGARDGDAAGGASGVEAPGVVMRGTLSAGAAAGG